MTETTPPPGYYLNPNLDSGTSSAVSTFPYTFRTGTLNGTTTVDVPGANAEWHFHVERPDIQRSAGDIAQRPSRASRNAA